jgi:micrococcal nuclease
MLLVLGLLAAGVVALVGMVGDPPAAEPGAAQRAVVTRVVDGDTIVVRVDGREERVRYIGVDAPELARADTGQPAECGGAEALAANEELVAGKAVDLERDVSDRDRFGRLLRHVWLAGSLVGERLVRDGVLEARSYPPDTSRDNELDAAGREARAAGIGIWGAC